MTDAVPQALFLLSTSSTEETNRFFLHDQYVDAVVQFGKRVEALNNSKGNSGVTVSLVRGPDQTFTDPMMLLIWTKYTDEVGTFAEGVIDPQPLVAQSPAPEA